MLPENVRIQPWPPTRLAVMAFMPAGWSQISSRNQRANRRRKLVKSPSMRRPVGVKSILLSFPSPGFSFSRSPLSPCFHSHSRGAIGYSLSKRLIQSECVPNFQRDPAARHGAKNFLQRFRRGTHSLFQLYLPGFIEHAVPAVAISQIQSDGQSRLRKIPALLCAYGANLLHCRSSLSLLPLSTSITWERTASRPETGLLIPSVNVTCPNRDMGFGRFLITSSGDDSPCKADKEHYQLRAMDQKVGNVTTFFLIEFSAP